MMSAAGARALETRDLIWLAALGSAARAAASIEAVQATLTSLVGAAVTPTTELIAAVLEEMRHGGHALPGPAGLTLTERGRETLTLLLMMPGQRPDTVLGQGTLRLKLAFTDLLDPPQRRLMLHGEIAALKDELDRLCRHCHDCATPGVFGRMWLGHQCERVRREISVLTAMVGCG